MFNLSCSLKRVFCVPRHERTCFSISSIGLDEFCLEKNLNCILFSIRVSCEFWTFSWTVCKAIKKIILSVRIDIFHLFSIETNTWAQTIRWSSNSNFCEVQMFSFLLMNKFHRNWFKLVDLTENRITNLREFKLNITFCESISFNRICSADWIVQYYRLIGIFIHSSIFFAQFFFRTQNIFGFNACHRISFQSFYFVCLVFWNICLIKKN